MSFPAAIAELHDLLDTSDNSASCSPAPLDSSLEPESPQPFSLSQNAAEALYAAAEAKAVLEHAKAQLAQATAALDALVDSGVLPEKGLPIVSGYSIYRQEGRASWTYPATVKELEAQLKKRKQLAEQLGEAT
ncbi:MAG: hypothetical protein ACRC1L_04885, partial [Prochlorococcaceae cyanobacterium]